ncbi:MAG: hypothetical protein IKC07_05565 [Clostridia bacterium]|nr:hypothetical protein [Clostridia bacterium]
MVGFFVPVNESVWEHLKLLFYPGILLGIIKYFIVGKNYANYFPAKIIGIFIGMFGIVVSFYTYTGIVGENFLIPDILTYVFGAIVMAITTIKITQSGKWQNWKNLLVIALIVMGVLFAIWTYNPPSLGIFQDYEAVFFLNMF